MDLSAFSGSIRGKRNLLVQEHKQLGFCYPQHIKLLEYVQALSFDLIIDLMAVLRLTARMCIQLDIESHVDLVLDLQRFQSIIFYPYSSSFILHFIFCRKEK